MTKTRAIELLTKQPTVREINAHLRGRSAYAYAYNEQGLFICRLYRARTTKGVLEVAALGTGKWIAIPETARVALTFAQKLPGDGGTSTRKLDIPVDRLL